MGKNVDYVYGFWLSKYVNNILFHIATQPKLLCWPKIALEYQRDTFMDDIIPCRSDQTCGNLKLGPMQLELF